jgi:hypothetical protein
MPRHQIAYVASCMAVMVGALCYMLCDFGSWPMLMYEPYEREWVMTSQMPSMVAMAYPGMMVWGLCGAASGAAVTVLGLSQRKKEMSPAALRLVGAWALTSAIVACVYFLWGLWPFA